MVNTDNEQGRRPYLNAANAVIDPEQAWAAFLLERVARAEDTLWGRPGEEVPAWTAFFTCQARMHISCALLSRLGMCIKPAAKESAAERMRAKNPVLAWDINLATRAEREASAASLLADLEATDGATLFETAPLLPALLDRAESRFVNAVREMGERLAVDAPRIAREFFGADDLGEILDAKLDGGDVHHGGRTVCTLTTPHGRMLYKPHDCQLDAAYDRLVRDHFSDVLVVPGVVAGDGYGWCAFVEELPIEDEAQAEAFFRRMGAAFALAHALGSSDLHMENWVACGEMPALIDLETVVTPRPRAFGTALRDEDHKEEGFQDDVSHSVLFLGMLPCLRNDVQLSPLLSDGPTTKCPPRLDGARRTVLGHEEAFFEGFAQGYDRCLALRDELEGWLDGIVDMPVRFLVRNTDYYARLWYRLMGPAALRSEQDRIAVTTRLAEYFVRHNAPELADIGRAEAASLLDGDIPYFCVSADTCDLCAEDLGHVVAPGYFATSSVQAARERLANLCEVDKQFELGLIRQTFEQALIKVDREAQMRAWKEHTALLRPIGPAEALEAATSILHELDDRALAGSSGQRGWVGRAGEEDGITCLRPFLSSGITGLGVFFAAFAASGAPASDRACAADLLDMTLTYLNRFAGAITPDKLSPVAAPALLGMSDGFGGMLLGLAHMQAALDDARCVETAQLIASLAGSIDLDEVTKADVYSGLAGLVAGLAACVRQGMLDTRVASPIAARAAERIAALRSVADPTAPEGTQAALLCDTIGKNRPIGGAGHGQIGIAYALLEAAALAPNHEHRADWVAAACDALAFEERSFSDKLGTWPDFRVSSKPTSAMHGLCSGAPGAGLAYLRCRDLGSRVGLSEDVLSGIDTGIRRAALACAHDAPMMRDHVCCGNGALLDFLVELIGRTPQAVDEATLDACRTKAREIAGAAAAPGWRFLPCGYREAFTPGLSYGIAGTGYELLRYAETGPDANTPARLVSVFL